MTARSAAGSGSQPSFTPAFAWTLALAAIALTGASIWLTSLNRRGSPAQVADMTLILLAVVGALVASRRPRDATGWIILGTALLGGLSGFLWEYGYRAVVNGESWLPLGSLSIWLGAWMWVPTAGVSVPAVLIRVPDGRIPIRSRGIDVLALAGSLALTASVALAPGTLLTGVNAPNAFALTAASGWIGALGWIGSAILAVAFAGSVWSLVARLRHAAGDERQQLKWIATAGALVSAALVFSLGQQFFTHDDLFLDLTPFFVSTMALPIGIGIAVLKYRLYEINLVINRALVYGGLTAMLAGIYAFAVGLTQRVVVFSGQRSDFAILITAFLAAAAFTPVKNWLQNTVDTKFAIEDPASVVDSLSRQIEVIVNVLDADRIARRLVEDAASNYRSRYVSLALEASPDVVPFHAIGDPTQPTVLRLGLHCRDQVVGVLSLAERRGGLAYTARDRDALQHWADRVAEAISLRESRPGAEVHSPETARNTV